MYSAHDFQIANLLVQLVPSMNITNIPYAANIQFELYNKGNSFFVKSLYNGQKISFEECDGYQDCSLGDWLTVMESRIYNGNGGAEQYRDEIAQKCNQKV